MSYQHYPHIIDTIISKYTNGQLNAATTNTYVKIGTTYIVPTVTITNVSKATGTNYIDLIIDTKIQFNSNGGTVTEIQVNIQFQHLNSTWGFLMCTQPGVTVGSGTTTINQRYITRFYTPQS